MARMPVHERREQLIDAATRVISREGVAGATTRRIAEQAGAPLASLHYSFADKEELFSAVIAHGVEQTHRMVADRALEPGGGLRRAVAGYLEMFLDWALADPDLMAAQYALLTWLLRTDRKAEAEQAYLRYFDGLLPVLFVAATENERNVDLGKLSRLAVLAADGMILQLISLGSSVVGDIEPLDVADGLIHIARAGKQSPDGS